MSESDASNDLTRISTGIAGFDAVLGGGLFTGGLYLLSGAPGTGKTVIGNQLAFNHVRAGGRVVFVTLLAESHARMFSHLRTLAFFDDARVGDAIYYLNGFHALETEGFDGFAALLRRTVRDRRATLLVIDGFSTAEVTAPSATDLKRFLIGLQAGICSVGCTTLFLSEHQDVVAPTHAMMDGLIELYDSSVGLTAVRELLIRKLRGSAHLRGRHVFEITADGCVVYPRVETRFQEKNVPSFDGRARVSIGVPALDAMLCGGLLPATTTMLLGTPGSGKTVLGLKFLVTGAEQNEPGLHFGFYESPDRLVALASSVGTDLKSAMDRKLITVHRERPLELPLDALADRLMNAVQQSKPKRIFLDGLGGFREGALRPERIGRFITAITDELRSLGITTVLAAETQDLMGQAIQAPINGISAAVETTVILRVVEFRSRLHRVLSILKERESEFDSSVREFTIRHDGLHVLEPLPDAEALLTGVAHQAGSAGVSNGHSSSTSTGGTLDDEDSHR